MNNKERYYHLIHLIKQLGVRRDKRHGEYIKAHVYDNYFLELDTWNSGILVYNGENIEDNLGLDFGGFYCKDTMVEFWIAHLRLCNHYV